MIIKSWIVRGVCEEEGGKLEEKDFTREFMADEFVNLVMKRKFEQIQERLVNQDKTRDKVKRLLAGESLERIDKEKDVEETK